MFPYRRDGGWGRGGDKGGDVGRGPGRGVETSEGGSEPEGVSGDTRPLGVVDMMVGKELGVKARPGSRFQKKSLGLGLEC